jgi:uncharacterized protein YndB with AHSA1/START domain
VPVVSSHKDVDGLTMTLVAEFNASVERVWRIWEDPRQLERWWGPPTWPATFDQHDFVVGGESRYYMTGPEGEKAGGWWTITVIDAPHRLEFEDGFADESGEPSATMPAMHIAVTIEPTGAGARMTTVTTFADTAQMEQVIAMGMEEGMTQAMGQIDALLG